MIYKNHRKAFDSVNRSLIRLEFFFYLWMLLLLFQSKATASVEDEMNLILGIDRYSSEAFEKAIEILEQVTKSETSTKEQKIKANLYIGASYYELGDKNEAKAHFGECVELDLEYTPSAVDATFPFGAIQIFHEIRSDLVTSLSITSTPNGVTVFADDDSVGITPYYEKVILRGEKTIRLTQEGYRDTVTLVQLQGGIKNEFHFMLEPLSCKFRVQSNPSYAVLNVDGSLLGYTPKDLAFPVGEAMHSLQFKKEGYRDTTITLQCNSGDIKTLTVNLTKIENRTKIGFKVGYSYHANKQVTYLYSLKNDGGDAEVFISYYFKENWTVKFSIETMYFRSPAKSDTASIRIAPITFNLEHHEPLKKSRPYLSLGFGIYMHWWSVRGKERSTEFLGSDETRMGLCFGLGVEHRLSSTLSLDTYVKYHRMFMLEEWPDFGNDPQFAIIGLGFNFGG